MTATLTAHDHETLAAVARAADLPHNRARKLCQALGIRPDTTVRAGRSQMWLFYNHRADQVAAQLRAASRHN